MKYLTSLTGKLLLGALVAAYLLSGCKKKDKDDQPTSGNPQTQGDSVWVEVMHEHPRSGIHVYVYALLHSSQNGQVREGYNRFRIKVEGYPNSDVKLLPMMYMTGMMHSCPTRQPDDRSPDGFFYAEAFFQMPTTVRDGTVTEPWKLHVIIGNDTATAEIRVHPHPNGWVRRRRFPNNNTLLYEFRPMGPFKVGTVPVSVYLYRRDMSISHSNPDGFPPAFDKVDLVQLNTWMPGMNHGAPGNEPATKVPESFGHYRGQIGFNMTGDWDIYLAFVDEHSHGDHMHTDTLGMDTIRVRF